MCNFMMKAAFSDRSLAGAKCLKYSRLSDFVIVVAQENTKVFRACGRGSDPSMATILSLLFFLNQYAYVSFYTAAFGKLGDLATVIQTKENAI